jgi:hypothetical protein
LPKFKIDQLKQGMTLADDVCTRNGRLLLAKGLELTDQQLLVLRTWGIQDVEIENSNNKLEEMESIPYQASKEQLEKAIAELKPIFNLVDVHHPFFQELLRIAAHKKVAIDEP